MGPCASYTVVAVAHEQHGTNDAEEVDVGLMSHDPRDVLISPPQFLLLIQQ